MRVQKATESRVANQRDVLELVDRSAIGLLLDLYAQIIDERRFEALLESIFTIDCLVELPPGVHRGVLGLCAFHANVMAPFTQTQHVFANYAIAVNGAQATFRANAHVTHVEANSYEGSGLFIAGGVLTGTAVLSEDGWKLSSVKLEPVWRDGEGPGPNMRVSAP